MSVVWYRLRFPANLTTDEVVRFVRTLAMRPRHGLLARTAPLIFEVHSGRGALSWLLGVIEPDNAGVLPQLRSSLPGVRLDELGSRNLPDIERAVELRLSTLRRPLRVDASDAVSASVLTALTDLSSGEVLVLQWLIGPWQARPVVKRTGTHRNGFAAEQLIRQVGLDTEDAASLKQKFAEPLLGAVVRVGVGGSSPCRQRQLVQRVLGALQLARQPGVGLVVRWIGSRQATLRMERLHTPVIGWPCSLNAAELSAVLGWPIGNPHLAGVVYSGGRQLPPPSGALVRGSDKHPRIVGHATYPGNSGDLQLRPADALTHFHCIGGTGSGKSTLLAGLIEADIAASRSVVVIEPKSDLIEHLLERIPAKRVGDVVLLDPGDRVAPVGFNPLSAGHDPELTADQLVHLFHALYRDSWGPRTAQLLHAALLTLASAGGQTLLELPVLLTDSAFRQRLIAGSDPLSTGPVWAWFESLSDGERAAAVGPVMNKISGFTSRRAIRSIIGQADGGFDLNRVFTQRGTVLLVNLAKGIVGPEAARLLGSLVFSALWQTALGRASVPPDRRHVVSVVIDEFQDYAKGLPLDLGEVLAQARGLGVAVSLAHQHLGQLDTTMRSEVLTNARSRVVFQTGSADGRALAAALGGGLSAEDLQSLGRYEAYAQLMVDGTPAGPASIVTLPPSTSKGSAPAVREASRTRWGRPIDEVNAAILTRRQPDPAPKVGGKRPRRTT